MVGTICGVKFSFFGLAYPGEQGYTEPPLNPALRDNAPALRGEANVFVNDMVGTTYCKNFSHFGFA